MAQVNPKKRRVIGARMDNPEVYEAIDKFCEKHHINPSELVRYAIGKVLGREKGPIIPEEVKRYFKHVVAGMGRE